MNYTLIAISDKGLVEANHVLREVILNLQQVSKLPANGIGADKRKAHLNINKIPGPFGHKINHLCTKLPNKYIKAKLLEVQENCVFDKLMHIHPPGLPPQSIAQT